MQDLKRSVDCPSTRPDGKVPLQRCWTFWYYQPSNSTSETSYEKQLQKLDEFSTVQDFWACYNAIPLVDQLQHKHCFHMMQKNVKPEWEDEANREGGEWNFKSDKGGAQDIWQRLLLCAIGEQYSHLSDGNELCGITVKGGIQNQYVFQIWHRDGSQKDTVLTTTQELLKDVEGCNDGDFKNKFYKSHKEELKKSTGQ